MGLKIIKVTQTLNEEPMPCYKANKALGLKVNHCAQAQFIKRKTESRGLRQKVWHLIATLKG